MNSTHQDTAPARKPWWIIIGVLRRPEFCRGITPAATWATCSSQAVFCTGVSRIFRPGHRSES